MTKIKVSPRLDLCMHCKYRISYTVKLEELKGFFFNVLKLRITDFIGFVIICFLDFSSHDMMRTVNTIFFFNTAPILNNETKHPSINIGTLTLIQPRKLLLMIYIS